MKKKDLNSGNVVELRNENKFIVIVKFEDVKFGYSTANYTFNNGCALYLGNYERKENPKTYSTKKRRNLR